MSVPNSKSPLTSYEEEFFYPLCISPANNNQHCLFLFPPFPNGRRSGRAGAALTAATTTTTANTTRTDPVWRQRRLMQHRRKEAKVRVYRVLKEIPLDDSEDHLKIERGKRERESFAMRRRIDNLREICPSSFCLPAKMRPRFPGFRRRPRKIN